MRLHPTSFGLAPRGPRRFTAWLKSRRARRLAGVLVMIGVSRGPPGLAQISPGPLSRAHEKLDGPLQCLSCHEGGQSVVRDRCLACHEEISWLLERRRGLHGEQDTNDCGRCHKEHGGRESVLIGFEEGSAEKFDHQKAGWSLEGRHTALECRGCHTPRYHVSEAARRMKRRQIEASYLGLDGQCIACHEDAHGLVLGPDCGSCHNAAAWKPAPSFDHAKTRYPLDGGHREVSCAKCHHHSRQPASGAGFAEIVVSFAPVNHGECSDCHRDPHEQRLGSACSCCHVVDSFLQTNQQVFDHARTAYPLEGKHRQVRCEACHRARETSTASPGSKAGAVLRPHHARCGDCHADVHGRQLVNRQPGGTECGDCHGVDGWRPSTYTAASHAKLALPLEGRHAKIECAACHVPGGKKLPPEVRLASLGRARVALSVLESRCEVCHADPHRGRFASIVAGSAKDGCRLCHGAESWQLSALDEGIHRALGYALEGAHRKTACEKCHPPTPADHPARPEPLPASLRGGQFAEARSSFKIEDKSCAACHQTPHGEQFARRHDRGACEACHTEQAFKPAPRFDHERSRFPLMRSHSRTKCVDCHDQQTDAQGRTMAIYRPTSFDCRECHIRKGLSPGGRLIKPARGEPRPTAGNRPR
ncbi:MAG: hypothetical protein JSV80_16725 [Acidobacteriota bacterium]|nr:MAG: hypothetical protein JSV80_16725 [Acidobacteriota bacterium]